MKDRKHTGRWQRSAIAVCSVLLAACTGVTAGAVSYKSLICSAIGGDKPGFARIITIYARKKSLAPFTLR